MDIISIEYYLFGWTGKKKRSLSEGGGEGGSDRIIAIIIIIENHHQEVTKEVMNVSSFEILIEGCVCLLMVTQ